MKKIVFLLLISINTNSQSSFIGEYKRGTKGGGFHIHINKDGSYSQKMFDCTWGFISKGFWTNCNDTIYLNARKLYSRNKKQISLTEKTTILETYKNMNKLFYRNDTLFIVFKQNTRYAMIKQNYSELK